jgi:type 1 glutamine amidotransferase
VRVLLSIDHPMSWCRDIARGRTFYTAFGHVADLHAMRWYRRHLLGGIRTAARAVKADCSPR